MAKKIKAISQIIDWDAEMGRTLILNPGDEGEASDRLADAKIADGFAEEVAKPAPADEPKKGKRKPAVPAPAEPAPEDGEGQADEGAPV